MNNSTLRYVTLCIPSTQSVTDVVRDARALAQLVHPNLVRIHSVEQHGDTLSLGMEPVAGEPLSAVIGRGAMSAGEVVRIASQVAEGLAAAHDKGVIHRDLRPKNILVAPSFVKISDFGLVSEVTPHYASPEQALGRPADARSDIFSLGIVMYEMLAGRKPFTADAATEVMLQIVMNEPKDIAAAVPGLSPSLADVVRRCMRKKPDERFANCEALREALVHREAATPAPTKTTTTPRALVADDDPTTRYLLSGVLAQHQIAVDEAENGADAVKFLKANDYSLVFLDLLMPRVDGWGVIDYLRTRRSAHPPRLFVVTGVQNQKLSVADQDVVSGLLYKPLDLSVVEKLVQ